MYIFNFSPVVSFSSRELYNRLFCLTLFIAALLLLELDAFETIGVFIQHLRILEHPEHDVSMVETVNPSPK